MITVRASKRSGAKTEVGGGGHSAVSANAFVLSVLLASGMVAPLRAQVAPLARFGTGGADISGDVRTTTDVALGLSGQHAVLGIEGEATAPALQTEGRAAARVWASAAVPAWPSSASARWVVSGTVATTTQASGAAARLELGGPSDRADLGLWLGARLGAVRADSLDELTWIPTAGTVRGPFLGGMMGTAVGVWVRALGLRFTASAATGQQSYSSLLIKQDTIATAPDTSGPTPPPRTRADSTRVVTRGLGALGRLGAQWADPAGRSVLAVEVGVMKTPVTPSLGWVSGSASIALAHGVAAVLAAGTRGTMTTPLVAGPSARRYVTGGLSFTRWPWGGSGGSTESRRRSTVGATRWEIRSTPDGQSSVLIVHAVNAHHVDVTGDVTDWVAVRLIESGPGEWALPTPLPSGLHRLTVRVDGGPWFPPSGASLADDGYGGVVGVIVVP